jgi:DNA-binding transcriptional LysR family regulator
MNSRQIELFAAVMKAGSVSRAAELLGVTQPGVSRAIAELERALGFRLFDRVRNRIVPTPEGKLFHTEVQASFRDHGAGQVRIGSLSALGSSLVPRAVRRFRELRPDIAVTLMVLPSRDVRDGVVSGAFDLGLAADEIDVSGVLHQPFVSPRALCAMPVGHPLSERETITPHDLAGIDFIAYVPEDRARQRLDLILSESGAAPPRVVVETIYAATVCALVAEGVGVGLVSPYAVAGVDPTRLVLKPFEPAVQSKSLLILPLDRPKSQLVRDFIDCLMAVR